MLNKKTFEVIFGDYGELVCPACGGSYLHHEEVTVFNRPEDDNQVVKTVVNGVGVVVKTHAPIDDNPSRRRDGLIIRFWCEGCSSRDQNPVKFFNLAIYQHKGVSYADWRIEETAR